MLGLQRQVEEASAEQNKISKRIKEAGKDKAQRDALITAGKLLVEQIKAMEPLLLIQLSGAPRNARSKTAGQLAFKLFGIPEAFASWLGLTGG